MANLTVNPMNKLASKVKKEKKLIWMFENKITFANKF